MNSPTEISPSDQLFLDALDKLFAERFDRLFAKMDAVLDRYPRAAGAQRDVSDESRIGIPEQSGATLLVVADNWGGLFDAIPALSNEPVTALDSAASDSASVVAAATEYISTDASSTCLTPIASSAFTGIEPEEFPLQIQQSEETVEVDEKVLRPTDTEVLRVAVVSARVRDSLAQRARDFLVHDPSAPRSLRRASLHPPRLHQLWRAPPRRRPWRAPPRRRGRPPRLLIRVRGRHPLLRERACHRPRRLRGASRDPRRRRPLRRHVWRPPWRLASRGRRPGRHGRRVDGLTAVPARRRGRRTVLSTVEVVRAGMPLPATAAPKASIPVPNCAFTTMQHHRTALQLAQQAVELASNSVELAHFDAMLVFADELPTPDISKEQANQGARQVFEVLSLPTDIFCNISIDMEMPGHMLLEEDQYQPWPPPDALRLMRFDSVLRSLPWPSFSMIEGCSVMCWVLSVSMASFALNQELEQRKCGGIIGGSMATGLLHNSPIGPAAHVHSKISCIVPQLSCMSFNPGPLFKLELHYNSKDDSLQYKIASTEFAFFMSVRPSPDQMISQFVKPVPAECNQDLHPLIQQPPLCCNSTAHLFMLLPSPDEDIAEHIQPRCFTANLAHAYSVDVAVVWLCSATNASHAVPMAREGTSAQNMMMLEPLLAVDMSRHAHLHLWQQSGTMLLCLNVEHTNCNQQLFVHKVHELSAHLSTHGLFRIVLHWYTARCIEFQPWPPPSQVQVFTEQGFNRVVIGILSEPEPGNLTPKPPLPPPKSNLTWFQLSVSFVLCCPLHLSALPCFNCVCCPECCNIWLEFLPCAAQVAEVFLVDSVHVKFAETGATPTMQQVVAPPAPPKDAGRLEVKQNKKQVIAQFLWDPGGFSPLHRLGGKPNFKKGGMSGVVHRWVSDYSPRRPKMIETRSTKGREPAAVGASKKL